MRPHTRLRVEPCYGHIAVLPFLSDAWPMALGHPAEESSRAYAAWEVE
ncbi:MAG: hypothetical protein JWM95_226 [Gemmatimonadetes bacterium]|nr:hypothetical protein [Gemmatimonadota bacterium]